MQEAFFPLQFGELPGIKDVRSTSRVPLTLGAVTIDSMKVCHPSGTVGYRVRSRGRTLVYIPDNELSTLRAELGQSRYWELVEFCAGADLLIHDAMYTMVEYPARRGWGHSTFEETVALAEDAGVRTLRLFHHAPERGIWKASYCDSGRNSLRRDRLLKLPPRQRANRLGSPSWPTMVE